MTVEVPIKPVTIYTSAELRTSLPFFYSLMDDDDNHNTRVWMAENQFTPRIVVMTAIFFVSLFAVSFPSLSKRIKILKIPRIVFFIGKHFGTGVILSTAFVHLLQDAFESLQSPAVNARWKVGRWTGLIILSSLLTIFLVEYISTSYVDHLHSNPSAPPSPSHSRSRSPVRAPPPSQPPTTETTPLVPPSIQRRSTSLPKSKAITYGASTPFHAKPRPNPHAHEHEHSPDTRDFFGGHHRHERRGGGHTHTHVHAHGLDDDDEDNGDELSETQEVRIGKKRQVVGILVLQLGIMIHSLVIGLTLAITTGSEFTSLVTAIIFHQLFEGLSLGIRIAALPQQNCEAQHPENGNANGIGEPLLLAQNGNGWDGGLGGKGDSDKGDGKGIGGLGGVCLKPILAVLFAIGTPVGIAIGLLVFVGDGDSVKLTLTQGLMSAISAGMLIYAACVEMLAGDFVMDRGLWRSGVWKQGVAVVSLGVGVMGMACVGA